MIIYNLVNTSTIPGNIKKSNYHLFREFIEMIDIFTESLCHRLIRADI